MMKIAGFPYKRCVLTSMLAILFLLPAAVLQVQSKAPASSKHAVELIMYEQEGCHYCQVWDDNIGGIYHKTPEGKFAPLRRVDIHMDDKVTNVRPVIYTPTFVIYKGGREVGRVTGYASDDQFWGLLEMLLKKQGFRPKQRVNTAG